jgi:hypothetical protein
MRYRQCETYTYPKTHLLQQLEALQGLNGIGGMDCIELRRRRGYLHLHGNRKVSGLNSMSNIIKELTKTRLKTSVGSPNATGVIECWEHYAGLDGCGTTVYSQGKKKPTLIDNSPPGTVCYTGPEKGDPITCRFGKH